VRQDDYFWLRDKDSPDTIAYLTAENAYAEAMMASTTGFQDALYREMLARIKEDDQSVPYPFGGWLYYSRTETGKQYAIHCRKRGPDGPEQITLDLNALAEGHPFCSLGAYSVTDDGRWLAYTVDFTGFRDYTLYVKDLTTGVLAAERIEKVSSVTWAADSLTMFYVAGGRRQAAAPPVASIGSARRSPRTRSSTRRPTRSSAWACGARAAARWCSRVQQLHHHRAALAAGRRAHRAVAAGAGARARPRVLGGSRPRPGGGTFYIRTNAGGRRNFRLVTAPVDDPAVEHWRELVPHRDDVMLEDVDVFADHVVVHERAEGLIRLHVTTTADGQSHHIEFPEPAYEVSADANAEYVAAAYRLRYQSFVTPASVYDYDVAARRLVLLKQQPVLGGFDPARYRSERIYATAGDGVRVPISLVYRAGTAARRHQPDAAGRLRRLRHAVPGDVLVEAA
jgi:oligopeptidase B